MSFCLFQTTTDNLISLTTSKPSLAVEDMEMCSDSEDDFTGHPPATSRHHGHFLSHEPPRHQRPEPPSVRSYPEAPRQSFPEPPPVRSFQSPEAPRQPRHEPPPTRSYPEAPRPSLPQPMMGRSYPEEEQRTISLQERLKNLAGMSSSPGNGELATFFPPAPVPVPRPMSVPPPAAAAPPPLPPPQMYSPNRPPPSTLHHQQNFRSPQSSGDFRPRHDFSPTRGRGGGNRGRPGPRW